MNLSNTDKFNGIRTPFYYYDTDLLRKTLQTINEETQKYDNYHVHYAVKANANLDVLSIINEYGIGIDCVSGGEVEQALRAGFPADKIVFAGVGKSDWEMIYRESHMPVKHSGSTFSMPRNFPFKGK